MPSTLETRGLVMKLKELFTAFVKEQKIPISQAQIDTIVPRFLNVLKELPNTNVEEYIKNPDNQQALKKAFLFATANGDELDEKDIKDQLISMLTPGNEKFPHPELKIGKKEFLEFLLLKYKKIDPKNNPEAAFTIKTVVNGLNKDDIDNALTDIVNLMGFDPSGIHRNLFPKAGITNTRDIPLVSHNAAFLNVLEADLKQSADYVAKEDLSNPIPSEPLSDAEIMRENLKNETKKVTQIEEEEIFSPFLDSIRKGPRPPGHKDDDK